MRSAFVFVLLGTLGGCASVPEIPNEEYVKVADILYTTECELKEAIAILKESDFKISKQLIDVTYSLNVIEVGSGTGSGNLVVPITNGTFSIGLTAGLEQANARNTQFKVQYESEELECLDAGVANAPQRIAGDLGLRNWLLETAKSLARARETPTSMSYEMKFGVTRNAELKPAFGVVLPSGHGYGASLTVAGVRDLSHSISVTAASINLSKGGKAQAQKNLDAAVQQFLLRNDN